MLFTIYRISDAVNNSIVLFGGAIHLPAPFIPIRKNTSPFPRSSYCQNAWAARNLMRGAEKLVEKKGKERKRNRSKILTLAPKQMTMKL